MEIFSLIMLTFIASVVGTITSFGIATVMVPTLAFFYPIGVTLLFTGVIHWFGNLWKMWFFRAGRQVRLALLFGIPGIIASFFGAQLLPFLSDVILSRVLGLFFLLYVIFVNRNKNWQIEANKSTAITGGLLSGFVSGIFGVGGAIRAAFLSAFNLEKEVFVFTAGAIGIFVDSGRILKYKLDGIILTDNLVVALVLAVPASYLGGYVGKRISDKVPQESFRTVITIALFLMAIKYVIWP
ncbi:MAG: sulfite exporter TauE/SafE family protein [Firmicutes bacterium]|nr:sulfite exporter TauE/SafE family protein [Bacillota bacterium]